MHLGTLTEPLLLFGGPYSNLDALLALQLRAEQLDIPPNQIICTGDIVAYCGQPFETVEVVRDWGIQVLMGNCEESFAANANDCGCGFEEGTSCDLLSVEWFQFANKELKQEQRDWFAQLPRTITFDFFDFKCQVVHGSVTSINQFLFDSHDDDVFLNQLSQTQSDLVIAGHCGIPFTKKIAGKIWHNAGVIGMPANDGTANTWFSLLTMNNDSVQLDFKQLHYDSYNAHKKMKRAGLDNGYAQALNTGLWPSMDVLPEAEKQKRGRPLLLSNTTFSLSSSIA